MLDAATVTATSRHAAQAFAYHPDDPRAVILVTDGKRGFQRFNTHLSPYLLNELLVEPSPSQVEIDAMLDYALDQPALTDIDVAHGWPV